ncbi:hypothetical protein D9M71_610120 [compost metagenome]
MHRAQATHRTEAARLDQAQQLHLHGQRHFANFIEEQGAAMGCFSQADLALVGAGERALLVAEQFTLEQRLGQAGAVDHHQRAVGPGAAHVHRAGEQFLAGTRLTLQQHRNLRWRRTLQAGQGSLERWRPTDQSLFLWLRRSEGDAGQAFDKGHHPALFIQDRPQFDIHMLGATRCVMNVQHPLRHLAIPRLAHRAMLAGLVARYGIVVRDPVAFLA